MKKILFVLSIAISITISAQKKYSNILNSTNIEEIESFMKEAHPDDSRKMILKRKLVSLKNASWMNNGKSTHKAEQPRAINKPILAEETKRSVDDPLKLAKQKLVRTAVNPTSYFTKMTDSVSKSKRIIEEKEQLRMAVNPTSYFTKNATPDGSTSFAVFEIKTAPVALNPTIYSIEAKKPTIEKKSAPVSSNPSNYYAKSNNDLVNFANKVGYNEDEFQKLFAQTSKAHKEKTVKLLNQLFDNDITNENAILLIKNNGDCNMVIRINGLENYNLAVPARGENFVTIKKGDYKLSGTLCEAPYFSTKTIAKNTLVTLNKTFTGFYKNEKLTKNTSGASN